MKNKKTNNNKSRKETRKISKEKKKNYKRKVDKRESIYSNIEPVQANITVRKKFDLKNINKPKLVIVILLLIAVIVYITLGIYNLIKNPSDSVIVYEGSISEEETVNGYIIRDETVITGENYKNGMVQIKSEGDRVASGDPIFRYYTSGEEDLKEKIAQLDVKIQEAMEENNEDIFSKDTKLLDTQISETLDKIYDLNDVQKIKEYKRDISEYITKKAKIAGELSPSGSYLKKLIDERSSYENELNSGAEYINATKSGIVSYRVDGLEETLNPNDFSKINKEFLENLNLKTGQIISTSNERGKIVNNFVAYIACISDTKEANSAEIGDKVKIALPSTKEVEAKIEYITKEENNQVTIIFSIHEGIDELLSYRKTSFDIIWWDAKGYKVPNSCIITENNLNYVIRTRAGYLDKVLIKVKKKTDSYSVVTNYSTSELEKFDLKSGVSTSIMLYDELILNPSDEQVKETT